MTILSEDAKAIMLLCGRFGDHDDQEPLEQREYNKVVQWLVARNLRPADLLAGASITELAAGTGLAEARLAALMGRGVQMGFAIESWSQSGIWVICRSDPEYPVRYKIHLKDKAPAILFGTGDQALLKGGGLAIIGSRNIDDEGEEFSRQVASWCAARQFPVVSGGARGVDAIAMTSALEAGGVVIGVLADSLLRRSVARESRHALADGRLLLLSPYHPEAGFSVGNAMGRNKLIYAMADYALVVSAELNKGGTWEGATEELKRTPGRPVFVRMSGRIPKGNQKLTELGAISFPDYDITDDPATVFKDAKDATPALPGDEMSLFDLPVSQKAVAMVMESRPIYAAILTETPVSPENPTTPVNIYEAVLPFLLDAASQPSSADDLATRLDLTKAQLQAWLKRAIADKKIIKKGRPVMYVKA